MSVLSTGLVSWWYDDQDNKIVGVDLTLEQLRFGTDIICDWYMFLGVTTEEYHMKELRPGMICITNENYCKISHLIVEGDIIKLTDHGEIPKDWLVDHIPE